MLITGIAAFAVGVLEFFLNTKLFPAVFAGDVKKAVISGFAKLAVYGAAVTALALWGREYAVGAAVGYGAGILLCIIVYAVTHITAKEGVNG